MEEIMIFISACLLLVFILLQVRHQIALERKKFHIRIHSTWKLLLQSLGYGLVGGAIASLLFIVIGILIRPVDIVGILIMAFILSFFRIRYLSILYGGSLLIIVALIIQRTGVLDELPFLSPLREYLNGVEIPGILASVALLTFIEGILLLIRREKGSIPIFITSQRGKMVGGYQIKYFWFLPIIMVTPPLSWLPNWWPLFGELTVNEEPTFSFFPAILGLTLLAVQHFPRQQAKKSGLWLLLFGLITFIFAIGSLTISSLGFFGALFIIIAHEGFLLYTNIKERKGKSIFANSNRGILVLQVLKGSPGEEMGVLPGEVVQKVNGQAVGSSEEFYKGLQRNSAFCKLEVLNHEGNVKYLQRSLYEGEHHLLGIIFAPEEGDSAYISNVDTGIYQFLFRKNENNQGA